MTGHDFLRHHVAQLLSPAPEPRRACPDCANPRPALAGPRAGTFGPLPRYVCTSCNMRYSRLTGTPLARLHMSRDAFVKLLAHMTTPMSIRRAAVETGIGQLALARLVRALRAWLLELDPSGVEEAKVQLGGLVLSPHALPRPAPKRSDEYLVRTLECAVRTLRSPHAVPMPVHCPHCGGGRIRLHQRAGRHTPQPVFHCEGCTRKFTRLTGTPLARSRSPDRQAAFLPYLSLPLQLTDVARALEVDFGTVRDWRERYHDLALQIDPGGALAKRIRLAPDLAGEPCGFCGRSDTLEWNPTRQWYCSGCGRFFAKRTTVR